MHFTTGRYTACGMMRNFEATSEPAKVTCKNCRCTTAWFKAWFDARGAERSGVIIRESDAADKRLMDWLDSA